MTVLVAIGSNLPHRRHGAPRAVCEAALAHLEAAGIAVLRRSRWFASAPVPASDQPDYVNGVAAVATALEPAALLAALHRVEADFGRERAVPNAARILDLDLLDVDGMVRGGPEAPILPHPRMHGRAFVLLPLRDVEPGWRHPVTGEGLDRLISAIPGDQGCRPLEPPRDPAER